MRILITGGAGFIGSHAALVLLKAGHDVIIYDSFFNSSENVIKAIKVYSKRQKLKFNLKTIRGDIRSHDSLNKVFKDSIIEGKPIESVIHFAGLKSVFESVRNPLEYWDVNVFGTKNLIEVMSTNKCYSLVFSSSATVYGQPESVPISEKCKLLPVNPYGRSKLAIENMLEDVYKSNVKMWKICVLRYFNPVGAHPSGFFGENPIGIPNNLFPFITQVAVGRRKFLEVFGDDWDTNDGSGVRDYIHVMDLVDGHLSAIDYLKTNCGFEVINLGSGSGFSVFQIINEFERSTGCKIPFIIKSRRAGDIAKSFADISKAKKLFGWIPKKSLQQICVDSWNWQRKYPSGYV